MKIPIQSSILVIFGVTGNLARIKLMPALYHLASSGNLPDDLIIVGVERRGVSKASYLSDLMVILEKGGTKVNDAAFKRLDQQLHLEHLDIDQPAAFTALKERLDELEASRSVCMHRLFYLAIPPQVFPSVVHNLGVSGLHTGCKHGVTESRLLVEKPFGSDLASADTLIQNLFEYFDEDHIYRIDHYVAKETVQNILAFRFNNPLFESSWDASHIERVTILASESIGIEGRGTFYEGVGALRDLIQSHLLQIMALVAMEEPTDSTAASIHSAKDKLLQAVIPLAGEAIDRQSVRGQYDGYPEEAASPTSFVETYAALKLEIDNDRWRGVPFYVVTGKALDRKTTDITIVFKHASKELQNKLVIRLQPDEGAILTITVKQPGFDDQLRPVEMEFCYNRSFEVASHDAYERVLIDALRGDKSLFTTSGSVLAAWRIIDKVVAAWAQNGDSLESYPMGTSGPAAARILLGS